MTTPCNQKVVKIQGLLILRNRKKISPTTAAIMHCWGSDQTTLNVTQGSENSRLCEG